MDKELIKKVFEKAAEGGDLSAFNLKFNPFFNTVDMSSLEMIDRNEEVKELSRDIFDLVHGRADHIAILGTHGVGKTHLLVWLYNVFNTHHDLMEKFGIDKIYYISGLSSFKENLSSRGSEYGPIIEEKLANKKKKILLFIDDLDLISKKLNEEALFVFDLFRNSIIGTWNPDIASESKSISLNRLPKPEIVPLKDLTEKDSIELLKYRIKKASIRPESKFDDATLRMLIRAVGVGNPNDILDYMRKYLEWLIQKRMMPGEDTLSSFLVSKGFVSRKQIIEQLSLLKENEKLILREILDRIEISAEEAAPILNMGRVGARGVLEEIVGHKLLSRKRKGHSIVYFVPSRIEKIVYDQLSHPETQDDQISLNEFNKEEVNDKKS